MNHIYTEENISLNSLFDYVFKKLPKEQDNAMEAFLDEHEIYANTVDGILNYCLNEGIKSKEDLEKNIKVNKELFFSKFPHLKASSLKKTVAKEKKSTNNNKLLGLLFLTILMLGIFSIWQKKSPVNNNEKIDTVKENNQKLPNEENSNMQDNEQTEENNPSIKDTKNESQKEPNQQRIDNQKEENNSRKNNTDQKSNSRLRAFKTIKNNLETKAPLIAEINDFWDKENKKNGNNSIAIIEQARELLAQGDTTQKALYYIGLDELKNTPPNLNKVIELLEKVKQYEYHKATWFLFRAYILNDNIEKAKIEFQKMHSNPEITLDYEKDFLKNMTESDKAFFQSNDN